MCYPKKSASWIAVEDMCVRVTVVVIDCAVVVVLLLHVMCVIMHLFVSHGCVPCICARWLCLREMS